MCNKCIEFEKQLLHGQGGECPECGTKFDKSCSGIPELRNNEYGYRTAYCHNNDIFKVDVTNSNIILNCAVCGAQLFLINGGSKEGVKNGMVSMCGII